MQEPVIVMGMMRSGTTLIAEMIHKGGTPMFVGDLDPSYNGGIKYERPLTHEINLAILGLSKNRHGIDMVGLPVRQEPSAEQLQRLADEVGDAPWGFKDPRTTLTYPAWCKVFPKGPRVYVYRNHEEVLRFYFNSREGAKKRIKRVRRAAVAWLYYNERVLENMRADQAARRPHALVRYEELMEEKSLIERIEEAAGVKLADARNWDLRRNKVSSGRERLIYRLATVGLAGRVTSAYNELGALRITAKNSTPRQSSTESEKLQQAQS